MSQVGQPCGTREEHLAMLSDSEDEHLDFHLGCALRLAIGLEDVEAGEHLLAALKARLDKLEFSTHAEREGASRLLADHGEELRAARDRRRERQRTRD